MNFNTWTILVVLTSLLGAPLQAAEPIDPAAQTEPGETALDMSPRRHLAEVTDHLKIADAEDRLPLVTAQLQAAPVNFNVAVRPLRREAPAIPDSSTQALSPIIQ